MYKYCNRCGERLPDNSRFCPSCGQALPWAGDVSPRGYDAGDDIQWMEPDMSATFSAMSRALEKKAVKEEPVWQEPVLEDFQVIYKKGKYVLPVDSFTVRYKLSNCTKAMLHITDGKSEDETGNPAGTGRISRTWEVEDVDFRLDGTVAAAFGGIAAVGGRRCGNSG